MTVIESGGLVFPLSLALWSQATPVKITNGRYGLSFCALCMNTPVSRKFLDCLYIVELWLLFWECMRVCVYVRAHVCFCASLFFL